MKIICKCNKGEKDMNKVITSLANKYKVSANKPFGRTNPKPLEKFGIYVWIDKGNLWDAPMKADGKMSSEKGLVTSPESQEFLDDVNALLQTDFKMSDFDGLAL